MVQGQIKKPNTRQGSASRSGQKKAPRQITPKKPTLAKQAKVTKKLTSGVAQKTEQLLGSRAGHLELVGPGKKAKKTGSGNGFLSAAKAGK